MNRRNYVDVVISSGQYEEATSLVKVSYTTFLGLTRRLKQLSKEHAVYGDNWAGWINADIAISSKEDVYGNNKIIGGQWCRPENEWLNLENSRVLQCQLRDAGIVF